MALGGLEIRRAEIARLRLIEAPAPPATPTRGSEAACNRTATEVFSGMRTEGQKARGRRDVERHHVDMNHARSGSQLALPAAL